jgi:hypothetical protein
MKSRDRRKRKICLVKQQVKKERRENKSTLFFSILLLLPPSLSLYSLLSPLSLSKNKASSLSLSKYSTTLTFILYFFLLYITRSPSLSLFPLSLSLHFPCSSYLLQQTHFSVLTTHIANTQRVCF